MCELSLLVKIYPYFRNVLFTMQIYSFFSYAPSYLCIYEEINLK